MSTHVYRILCVEDDDDFCEIVSFVFKQGDYDVTVASTGAEGLRRAAEEFFDVYLIDQWLNDMDGIELCRQVRAFDPHAPIFICTADAREATRQEAVAAGATEFLVKPIDPFQLTHLVGRHLTGLERRALDTKIAVCLSLTER